MMPITSKRRVVDKETGQTVEGVLILVLTRCTFSEHTTDWDIVFADDERESNPTSFKFLQMAHAWKAAQAKSGSGPTAPLSGFVAAANNESPSIRKGVQNSDVRDSKADDGSSDVASSNGDDD